MRTACLIACLTFAGCNPEQVSHPVPYLPQPAVASLAPQDRDFLERAVEGNNAEVAIGTLPARRDASMRSIAMGQMLVRDHRRANAVLIRIASSRNIALPTSLGEEQSAFDRLVDLRDRAFDEEFRKVAIETHQRALDLYRSEASGGVDPALRQYAADMIPLIEAHLAHAKSSEVSGTGF